jgi:hypothetical protein
MVSQLVKKLPTFYVALRFITVNEISVSEGGEYEDCSLLDCFAVNSGRILPTFGGIALMM